MSYSPVQKVPLENAAFMDRHIRQELQRRDELVASGQLLDLEQFATQMKSSHEAIREAIQSGRIFALDSTAGKQLYPAFYVSNRLDREQVERVTQALGDLPASSKWQFFTTPKISLSGKTPIEALACGDLDAVMIAAAGFLEA